MASTSSAKADGITAGFLWTSSFWTVFLGFNLLIWQSLVNSIVPEPYLDEVFHVPQAQRYCSNNLDWDPKITTPPGIYLFSRVAHALGVPCTASSLRGINAVLTMLLILPASFLVRASSNASHVEPSNDSHRRAWRMRLAGDLHAAVNVCLFPPLFFFTALYYTDVGSTAIVLLFIALLDSRPEFVHEVARLLIENVCLLLGPFIFIRGHWAAGVALLPLGLLLGRIVKMSSRPNDRDNRLLASTSPWLVVMFGLLALLFRQTNVFWVGVFPVGWRLFTIMNQASEVDPRARGYKTILPKPYERWAESPNPTIGEAGLLDYPQAATSVALQTVLATVLNVSGGMPVLPFMSQVFIPFALLLSSFAAFVLWNGGVVLGDKSNHVATIHLPQMLYLWPYITFFSLPLIYPYIITAAGSLIKRFTPRQGYLPTMLRPYAVDYPLRKAWQFAVALLFLLAALMIIHFNTIVHPFTLADNRHYVFYVFRLLVLRHPATKYIAAPVYLTCGWLVIRTLGTPRSLKEHENLKDRTMRDLPADEGKHASSQPKSDDKSAPDQLATRPAVDQVETRVGFVIIWLVTSALCLVTAPLVEPRYYIIPWVIWRLQVPSPSALDYQESQESKKEGQKDTTRGTESGALFTMFQTDHRLWLETAWFLMINVVTGYLFLFRGFEWPQEPGRIQRFLW